MLIDGIASVTEAFPKTVRLVSTARLRDSVLKPLVDNDDELALLSQIEGLALDPRGGLFVGFLGPRVLVGIVAVVIGRIV